MEDGSRPRFCTTARLSKHPSDSLLARRKFGRRLFADRRAPETPVRRGRSSGGYSGRATPDPIPNSVVKPSSADGTAGETLWESRTPPDLWPPPRGGGRFYWFFTRSPHPAGKTFAPRRGIGGELSGRTGASARATTRARARSARTPRRVVDADSAQRAGRLSSGARFLATKSQASGAAWQRDCGCRVGMGGAGRGGALRLSTGNPWAWSGLSRPRPPRRHGRGWTGRRTAHCRLETHRPGRGSRDCGCRNPSAWVGLNGAAHCGCRLETRRPGRGS
jgi:hypothetical protein